MEEKLEILGLGAICWDKVYVIPHFPEPDEKIDAESEMLFPGGVMGNYITACARLGVKSAFIGAVGNDSAGKELIENMQNEGIYMEYCKKKDNAKTGNNIILVRKSDGQKMIIQSPYFTQTRLKPDDLKEEWFNGPKLLHITGVHEELAVKAVNLAKKHGMMVSFDLESQIAIRGLEKLKPLLDNTDILLPNKLGAKTLTDESDPIKAAKKFIAMGISIVVVTLGEEGAAAITVDGDVIKAPAFKINPVDSTGAGDTFCGAFTTAYVVKGWSIEKSLTFANACAAIKMLKFGARTGMPTYNEAIQFLKDHNFSDFE
ncbi:MAG: carbohydrate kinase family protein [Promethearchaeota archaeon]